MKFFTTVLLLCSASAMAAKRGLRGVNQNEPSPANGIKSRKLMMGGGNCSQQSMMLAQPVQCNPREAATFSYRECAWVCKALPENSPQSNTIPASGPQPRSATPYQASSTLPASGPQSRSATPYQAAKPVPTARKGGSKGGNCSQESMQLAQPVQCLPGDAAVFSYRECAWLCKALPEASAQAQMNTLPSTNPQSRSATPYQTQTYSSAKKGGNKGGSKGGSLCQYDPITNPMVPCPSGFAAVFNHRSCAWTCKAMPAQGLQAGTPQTRSATPQARSATQPAQAKKGGSKLCQYDPITNPMVPCPSGYASVFNHKDCNWVCKEMPEGQQAGAPSLESGNPQPRSAATTSYEKQASSTEQLVCPTNHIPVYNKTTGIHQCMPGNMKCPQGEQMIYEEQTGKFYCGN